MGKESSIVWFAKLCLKPEFSPWLLENSNFKRPLENRTLLVKSLLCVDWRLTCALQSTGLRHSCLLIFKAKSRNLSTAEVDDMENSCDIALVPLSPSSLLVLSLEQRITK